MSLLLDLRFSAKHPRVALAAMLARDHSIVCVQNVIDLARMRDASTKGILNELDALQQFLGLPRTFLALAMANGANLVAARWLKEQPETAEEIQKFYGSSWECLYHLAFSNLFPKYVSLLALLKDEKDGRCLSFGGGIGGEALSLAAQGNEVWYHDLPDSPVWKFAMWRANKAGLHIHFTRDVPTDVEFDCVVAFNVFQLLPASVLQVVLPQLVSVLKPGGRLYCNNDFDYLEKNRNTLPKGQLWTALFSQHFNHQELWDKLVPQVGLRQVSRQICEKRTELRPEISGGKRHEPETHVNEQH